jgi:cobyrinic acid a,c-diamide synthase
MTRALLIAGSSSGVGKTTVVAGLLAALRGRGLSAQPFKAGPDYIDPSYHAAAAGVPCRNLDTWLLPPDTLRELFARACRNADIAIVEGVMGLYDGRSATTEEGSTAQLAKLLGLPVILVVDAGKAARSVAATVLGFQLFDPGVHLVCVLLNNIGSPGHYAICRDAVEHATGMPVFGYLPRRDDITLPERHLGLIPAVEGLARADYFARLAANLIHTVDVDRLMSLASPVALPPASDSLFPINPLPSQTRIAVAMDKAFSFYYQDSLDLLAAWGAELVPFSPLTDTALPGDIGGVYLGGGFPELYAEQLSANTPMHAALRCAAQQRIPIYAECGGLMYLGNSITDLADKTHPMAGHIPTCSRMTGTRLTIGYRTVQALADGPLLRAGETVRGHEFHWSALDSAPEPDMAAYELTDGPTRREGFHAGPVLASYIHIHFGSNLLLARRFVDACTRLHAGSEARADSGQVRPAGPVYR